MAKVSELVDADKYKAVFGFMERHIEMQIDDLRVLLQLPSGDFKAGCNFASVTLLLNLISGFSVCLYNASQQGLTSRRDRSQRFTGLLKNYYPWASETYSADNWRQGRSSGLIGHPPHRLARKL